MSIDLTETKIQSLIVRDFHTDEKVRVEQSLAGLTPLQTAISMPLNRIVIAVLYLANGDPDMIPHYVQAALGDPRDVIFWAEYNGKDTISDDYQNWLTRDLD